MIRLHGITKQYRTGTTTHVVLQGLELEVTPAQLVAVLGRSGSGKTTLLNIIGGLETAYQGRAMVAGKLLRELDDNELSSFRNLTVGFVFQAFYLLEHLSCRDNVALPALFVPPQQQMSRHQERQRAAELLDAVGLGDKANAKAHRLSGGERQRLAVARALFHRPPLLLCDEITGNLDRQSGEKILELLQQASRQRGVTVVVATHDPQVAQLADRVVRLRDGVVVPEDPM